MIKNLCFLLILLFYFSFQNSNAQAPNWQLAKTIGGINNDEGRSIVIDASGNVYTSGTFYGTVDFDPDTSVFNLTLGGGFITFISKLDSSGDFLWAKAMARRIRSMQLDASGNILILGTFSGTVDFDPGVAQTNLTSVGSLDIFITKLDSAGNFVWAKQLGGGDFDVGYSICIDNTGNVITSGLFSGTSDFNPNSSINYNLTSAGGQDIFVSKLDNNGNFVWAKAMGGFYDDYALSIQVDDSNNVYTTGGFKGGDFDPDAGVFYLATSGFTDIFVSKLNSSGNFQWAKAMGGTLSDIGNSIAIDDSENVFLTGTFQGTADFDPDASGLFNLSAIGGTDIYITKLNSSGNFIWAKAIGGTSYVTSNDITLDASANIYTTGYFSGTIDFDPNSLTTYLETSVGADDIFISKLDSSGNFVWTKVMGGSDYDYGSSVVINASGNAYLLGNFNSTSVILGSTILTNADLTGSTSDIFIAKLNTINTGIENVQNQYDVSIYPNPAINQVFISFPNHFNKIIATIFDIRGKVISESTLINPDNLYLSTKELINGVYLLKIETEKFTKTKRLIVSR